ncbi:hypothetical protein MUP01_04795 [Candidatus Bathyarchaeota archaeon]|nr:hypothetical protein [Candidatus Bathyarchaeota archaeon]
MPISEKVTKATIGFLAQLETEYKLNEQRMVRQLYDEIADVVKQYRMETVITALRLIEHRILQSQIEAQTEDKTKTESNGKSTASIA